MYEPHSPLYGAMTASDEQMTARLSNRTDSISSFTSDREHKSSGEVVEGELDGKVPDRPSTGSFSSTPPSIPTKINDKGELIVFS